MLKSATTFCFSFLVFLFSSAFSQVNFGSAQNPALVSSDQIFAQADTTQNQGSDQHEVGKITPEQEKQVERRVIAKNYNSLGIGPAGLTNLSSDNLDYLFEYAYYWEVASWAAIKFKSDNVFDFSKTSFFLAATIGSNFYLTPTNISPFIGLDFGMGVAKKPHFDSDFGFVVGGSVGVALFRTATAQMMLDLNVQTLLNKIDNSNPGKYSLCISVLF